MKKIRIFLYHIVSFFLSRSTFRLYDMLWWASFYKICLGKNLNIASVKSATPRTTTRNGLYFNMQLIVMKDLQPSDIIEVLQKHFTVRTYCASLRALDSQVKRWESNCNVRTSREAYKVWVACTKEPEVSVPLHRPYGLWEDSDHYVTLTEGLLYLLVQVVVHGKGSLGIEKRIVCLGSRTVDQGMTLFLKINSAENELIIGVADIRCPFPQEFFGTKKVYA
jgi:hypothetical protein